MNLAIKAHLTECVSTEEKNREISEKCTHSVGHQIEIKFPAKLFLLSILMKKFFFLPKLNLFRFLKWTV